ncbi:MAG: carboxymuconolactone decarboxylase family protein [Chloroflexota bacterium]|nr:carboxymuconolactone decarboxylase family protein [Chloroflexota bacterium]
MTRNAWIAMIEESESSGPLAESYDRLRDPETGQVDNILRIHSLHPETLDAHVLLYKSLMHGKSRLARAEREMIAVVVSSLNQCHY